MAIEAVLFDKDGTLIDYYKTWMPLNHRAALTIAGEDRDLADRLLMAGGWDPETDRIQPGSLLAAGNTNEIVDGWLPLLPDGTPPRTELIKQVDRLFQEDLELHATPVTNLHDLFARLKAKGLKLGVATSDSEEGARRSLGPFDILDQLDFVCGYDSGHGAKPGPGMVQGFCKAIDVPPEAVMVVGDNTHDLHMAHAAGAGLAVGVLTGTSSREDLAPDADHVVDSIDALEDLLAA